MKTRLVYGSLVLCLVVTSAGAEETLQDGARKAGRATGEVVHDVGEGAKKIGKEIGQGAKEAGKAVGSAAREGGREFKKAVKGEN